MYVNRPHVYLLAAMSKDGFIAHSREDKLNWVPKEDKLWFKDFTLRKRFVIVGRKTFELLPKVALKGRIYIVYTTNNVETPSLGPVIKQVAQGVYYTNRGVYTLLSMLHSIGVNEVVVAGGGKIYDIFLQHRVVDTVFLTVVEKKLGSGIRFPVHHLENFKVQDVERFFGYQRYKYVRRDLITS